MKLVKPSFEIIKQNPGLDGILQHIEKCGRTCYKSEDKITEESAPKFVDMIINRGHTAMLEHGTVYLHKRVGYAEDAWWTEKYFQNKYTEISELHLPNEECFDLYVTTNYRVLLQNGWLDDLQYQCEPTEYHAKRVTVKFVCDRGVSHEFVRHRVFSFAQESTRYCNYAKDKFNNECTFIIPSWLPEIKLEGSYKWHSWCGIDTYGPGKDCFTSEEAYKNRTGTDFIDDSDEGLFLSSLSSAEFHYFELLKRGWIAQQARAVLPNSLKTELVMTGTIEQWEGFFKLRDAKDAHPQARELAEPLHAWFRKEGWVE